MRIFYTFALYENKIKLNKQDLHQVRNSTNSKGYQVFVKKNLETEYDDAEHPLHLKHLTQLFFFKQQLPFLRTFF